MATADIIARLRLNGESFSQDFRSRMGEIETQARATSGRLGTIFQTGFKSAADSASVFIQGQQAADRMLASVNPLFAAQQRYNQAMAQANELQATGMLVGSRYVQVRAGLKAAYDEEVVLLGRVGHGSGQTRLAQMELMHVARATADQFAAGAPPLQIFTMHLGQLAQAASFGGDSMGRFGRLMQGWWGLAITGGIVLLTTLIGKLMETGDTIESETRKLEENARKAELTRLAHEAYGRTLPGIIENIREQTRALDDQNRSLNQNQQLALNRARGNADQLRVDRSNLPLQIAAARGALEEARRAQGQLDAMAIAEAAARSGGGQTTSRPGTEAVLAADRRVAELEARLHALPAQIEEADRAVRLAQVQISDRTVTDRIDEVAAANDRLVDSLDRLRDRYTAGRISQRNYEAEQERLRRATAREVEQIQERQRLARQRPDGDLTAFHLPVRGRVTGGFGTDRGDHHHAGLDLGVPVGTAVGAAATGTVIEIGNLPGYGNVVIIDHGRGTTTRYAHLSQIMVSRGQHVEQGAEIGLSGGARGAPGAGNSRGPHVHFEVRRNGRPVPWGAGQFPTDEVASERSGESAARHAATEAEARARILREMEASTAQAVEQARLGDLRLRGLGQEAEVDQRLNENRRQAAERLQQLQQHGATADDVAAQQQISDGLQDQLALYEDQAAAMSQMLIAHRDRGKLTDDERAQEQALATAMQQTLVGAQQMGSTIEDNLQVENAIVRAENAKNVALAEGNHLREKEVAASRQLIEEQERQLDQMKADMIRRQEDQFRGLADLYEELFSGHTDNIWKDFKRAGIRAIAEIAAAWTLAQISGQQFNLGATVSQMGSSGNLGPFGSLLSLFGGGGKGAAGAGAGGMLGGLGQALPYIGAGMAITSGLSSLFGIKNHAGGIFGIGGNLLINALTPSKRGSATLGYSDGAFGVGSTRGNSGSFIAASSTAIGSVATSLDRIAEMLGGTVTGAGSVSIGQRDGKWRVDPSGRGITKTKKGAVDFGDDQEAAIRYALADALSDGVIGGISDAAKHILASGKDLDKAIEKAVMIESIPKLLKQHLDPVGAALDALNEKWAKTIAALNEGGASAEQMAAAQKLYKIELEDTKAQTAEASASLKEFLASLQIGPNSPYSLRDQEARAQAALQPFLDQIAAGDAIDQGKYQEVAQTYLDIERQLYGSTGPFFEAMDKVMAATGKAIERIDSAVPIRTAADPFAEATATNTRTMTEQMEDQSALLIDIREILANLGQSSGGGAGFIGGGGGFSLIKAA